MRSDEGRRLGWLNHERRVFVLSIVAGLPAVVASIVLLLREDYSTKVTWSLGTVIVGVWLVVSLILRERVVRAVQTLSFLLAEFRVGDFSLRGRSSQSGQALALAFLGVNALGNTLQAQRRGAMEATALLRTVMAE